MSGTHINILLINIYSGIGMDDCMLCACVDVNARAGRTLACGALLSSPRRCRRTQACATAERTPLRSTAVVVLSVRWVFDVALRAERACAQTPRSRQSE